MIKQMSAIALLVTLPVLSQAQSISLRNAWHDAVTATVTCPDGKTTEVQVGAAQTNFVPACSSDGSLRVDVLIPSQSPAISGECFNMSSYNRGNMTSVEYTINATQVPQKQGGYIPVCWKSREAPPV